VSSITIYTKEGCPYCAAAKKKYSEDGKAFEEIDVNNVTGAKEKLLELTKGQRIVPVIVEEGQVQIGFGGG